MPTRLRINIAGYHHIMNRGVDQTDVFRHSAKKICHDKGEKWRLSTFNELQKLTHAKALSNAPKSDDIFWTIEEDESMPEGDYHLTISSTGQLGTNEGRLTHSVLCVKISVR